MRRMSDHPANWYPDPTDRHELRYYDGAAWTDHVSDQGITGTDPIQGGPEPKAKMLDRLDGGLTVGNEGRPDTINRQLTGTGHRGIGLTGPVGGGGGGLLTEPILVVNQKAKLIELNNQYTVFDQHGTQVAAVNQVGQSAVKKAMRLVSSLDQFMTHHLQITDPTGQVLLQLTRPRKVMKSSVIVTDGAGNEIGRIVQKNMIGKINFALQSGGQELGSIKAENWRAWNFRIEDADGNEIARITKTFEGIAKTMFTTADNYVLQITRRAAEPLNSLVVASALSIDTALKQDSRGLG
ncbi:MAG: phospholipid scramblase-related protein [Ilumatobacteraceae bacterium]